MVTETISAFGVDLTLIKKADIEQIRNWRNHIDVSRFMLNADYISEQQQLQWFLSQAEDPAQQHYMISYKDQKMGVINFRSSTNQPLKQSGCIEIGMYLDPTSRYRGTVLAFCPALAVNDYCFDVLGCELLQAVVLPENEQALRFNQQLGYVEKTRTEKLVYLTMNKNDYDTAKDKLKKVIRF
jgi:RimJ/RimL family protein N-acetyltransferase